MDTKRNSCSGNKGEHSHLTQKLICCCCADKKLAEFVAKLLKNPRDVKERAALEVFIARELYSLSPDDWKHLTSTFTFGGDSDTKAELDEIIRQSVELW